MSRTALTTEELTMIHDAILTHPILATSKGDRLDQIGDKIMAMILEDSDTTSRTTALIQAGYPAAEVNAWLISPGDYGGMLDGESGTDPARLEAWLDDQPGRRTT